MARGRHMSDFEQLVKDPQFFTAIYIATYGLGAVIFTAIVIQRFYLQLIVVLILSMIAASLFGSGAWDFALFPKSGGAWVLFPAVAFPLLLLVHLAFPKRSRRRTKMQGRLIPHLWVGPDARPAPFQDLRKRWFVTVSACAGNVAGLV